MFIPVLQERFVIQVTDLLTVSMMLGITAQVKEAGIAWDKGEKKSECYVFVLMMYLWSIICTISFALNTRLVCVRSGGPEVVSESDSFHPERCCLVASHRGSHHQQSWRKRLRSLVGNCMYIMCFYCSKLIMFSATLHMNYLFHVRSLHKVLFTEQPETYYKWDNWPPESDRKWVFLHSSKWIFFFSDCIQHCLFMFFYSSVSSFASAPRCLCWRTHWCAFWWSGCHVICPWARPMPWSSQITWLRGLLEFSLMVCEDPLRL